MRFHRVRFTRKKQPRTIRRFEHGGEGQVGTRFRNSKAGRYAKLEAIGEQRRKQDSVCSRCNQFLELDDAVFESKIFHEGVENKVIHRRCK